MEVTYIITYHPLVVRDDIPRIDVLHRRKIKESIERKLTIHPDIFGVPLRRSLKGHRKLRVGDYRVVFRIERKDVRILAIMHRSLVYEKSLHRT